MGDGKAVTASLVASLGAFLFGLDIGYIAPILECASFKRDVGHLPDFADPKSKISSMEAGFIVGIFSLGCLTTSFPPISSYFLDEIGRRSSIILGGIIFLLGCGLQAGSGSIATFLFGRLVTGTSIGLLSNVVPLYQAEMAPPALRGTLTSMYNMMITAGIFTAALLDMLLVEKNNGWRAAICLQAIPAMIILVVMPCLPRSPRWLVRQGRITEASDALTILRGAETGAKELEEILKEFKAECEVASGTWKEVFSGRVVRLVAIGASLQLLQQLVGMNAFMYFGPRMFKHLDLDPNLFQTIANGVNMVFTLPALYFIERTGRRSLLVVGALGMAISSFTLGVLGLWGTRGHGEEVTPNSELIARILAAMVLFFIASFAATWGPTVWVYCAEMFPLRHRARCLGVTTMTNWVGNFLIAQFTPVLLSAMGFGTFIIFAGFSVTALFLGLWLPETRGIPLEQIGHCFDERFGVLVKTSATEGYGAVEKRL
mmetsp:Transcript_39207/g.73112  ORF Transcript_39207/g.73112 Transcript_39207/m.73112 type:complete len:487 (-) Transcript_39207:131-1591(-)